MVIIKSKKGLSGEIKIIATSEGLTTKDITIESR